MCNKWMSNLAIKISRQRSLRIKKSYFEQLTRSQVAIHFSWKWNCNSSSGASHALAVSSFLPQYSLTSLSFPLPFHALGRERGRVPPAAKFPPIPPYVIVVVVWEWERMCVWSGRRRLATTRTHLHMAVRVWRGILKNHSVRKFSSTFLFEVIR